MNIAFDEKRALAVFKILDLEWRAKRGVFANIVLPQDRLRLPRNNERKVNFLFYSALFMRGGIISEDPFRWLVTLHDKRPEYFNPEFVVKNGLTPDDIKDAFIAITPKVLAQNGLVPGRKANGSGNPFAYKIDQHTKSWIANSQFFVKEFDGNILNIFAGVRDFEEAFARINRNDRQRNGGDGILGMRRKIFSLFTIWLQEKNLIPRFPTPIPVDFHALRILWATEILSLPDLLPFKINDRHPKSYAGKTATQTREKLIDAITRWSQIFLFANRISHLVINPALWVLSRDLCANHFQNSTLAKGTIFREPTDLLIGQLRWPIGYKNPCQICPIEQYCEGAVPAAPYYIWGILMRMPRVPYFETMAQTALPGLEEEASSLLRKMRRRSVKK